MRGPLLFLVALALACWAVPAEAQKGKKPPPKTTLSPADYFPEKTSIYVEFVQPGQLAKEVRDLFKGSVLYNIPDSAAKLRAEYGKADVYGSVGTTVGVMGLMLSPEVVKDLQRSKGMGAGWIGLGKNFSPEYLVVVLPGDSAFLGLSVRSMFIGPQTRLTETVEGVNLYAFEGGSPFMMMGPFGVGSKKTIRKEEKKEYKYEKKEEKRPIEPPPFKEKREFKEEKKEFDKKSDKLSAVDVVCCEEQPEGQEEHAGPVVALLPDAFLIGSPAAVKEAIRRVKKKGEATAALAKDKMFQEMRQKAGTVPGLFAYINMSDVPGLNDVPKGMLALPGMEWVEPLNKMVNPKAFRAYAINAGLQKGVMQYHEVLLLNPKEKSQLLELLPSKAVNTELLHYAPKDAVLVSAMANDKGAKRWERLVALIDAFNPPRKNGGDRPSEHIKKMEEHLGVNIGEDVFGKITNVAFVVGDPFSAPTEEIHTKGPNYETHSRQTKVPMLLILETTDAKAAKKLMELIPKVGEMAAHRPVTAKKHEIKGQTVYALPMDPSYAVHYARAGNVVIIGPYGPPIAQALADGADKKGLLADTKLADRLKAEEGTQVSLFLMKPITGLGSLTMVTAMSGGTSMKMKSTAPKIEKSFEIKEKEPFPPKEPSSPKKKGDKRDFDEGTKKDVDKSIKKESSERKPDLDPQVPKDRLEVQIDQFELKRSDKQVIRLQFKDGKEEIKKERPGGKDGPPQQKTEVKQIKDDPDTARVKTELRKILSKEGWFVLSVTRGEGFIRSDGQGTGLQQVVPKLTNFFVEEGYKAQQRFMDMRKKWDLEDKKFREKRDEQFRDELKKGEFRSEKKEIREEKKEIREEKKEIREEKKAAPATPDKLSCLPRTESLGRLVRVAVLETSHRQPVRARAVRVDRAC